MKKRILVALLGATFASVTVAGSASAMTYGYRTQGKNGPVEWFVTEQNGETAAATETDVVMKGPDGRSVQMQEAVAYLEKFGVSYDADSDAIYYQGRKVRWLIDEQMEAGTSKAIHMPEGEIDLYTVRGSDYQLTGVRVAAQKEYDKKTQEDLLAKQNLEVACVLEGSAQDSVQMDPDGSITYELEEDVLKNADGSVTYKLGTEARKNPDGSVTYQLERNAQEIPDDSITCTLVGVDAQRGSDFSITYSTEVETELMSEDDTDLIEQDCEATCVEAGTDGFYDPEAKAEYQKKAKEYEKYGLTAEDSSGGWLWNGRTVYCLMDEDGSFTQNGSADEKIYILVTRKEDGSIDEVREVTLEDILKEKIKSDAMSE